ncbi:MAG: hypothetical protein FWD23_11580 [Oscillospiraceae bacterium]|nr:hypothetical protein [Oscillospiraceae bacterium]
MKMQSVSVLTDTLFQNGFICSGASHEDGIVGKLESPAAKKAPDWKICQWATKCNICKGAYSSKTTGYSYKTDSQLVSVSWEKEKPILTLELLASKEYDSPRIGWQPWPHLLIEQSFVRDKFPPLGELLSLILNFDFRIPWFRRMMDNPDNSLHTAQANIFFTVNSMKNEDMFWFGVPAFDVRYRHIANFQAEDTGKDDASHKYIYLAAQDNFTNKSAHDGEIIEYEKDLLPLIKGGLRDAAKAKFLLSDDISEYAVTSCNIGFEMPGTFDASFEIYRLGLEAVKR